MVTTELGVILDDLGRELGVSNLEPDDNQTCLIRLKNGVEVQIELDRGGNFLVIGSDLGEIPPGGYRENLFEAALKSNSHNIPRAGTFAYSKQVDHLIVYDKLFLRNLSGIKVVDFVELFSARVKMWQESIKHNEIPIVETGTSISQKGIFGLQP